MSLYRDDRLAAELPNWEWVKKPFGYGRLEPPRNPSDDLLDALDQARLDIPDCKLWWDKEAKEGVITGLFLSRQAKYRIPKPVDPFNDEIPF